MQSGCKFLDLDVPLLDFPDFVLTDFFLMLIFEDMLSEDEVEGGTMVVLAKKVLSVLPRIGNSACVITLLGLETGVDTHKP